MPAGHTTTRPRRRVLNAWLGLNMLIGLCPIPYFYVGAPALQIAGLPGAILYCLALLVSVSASLFAVYRDDDQRAYFADTDTAGTPRP